MSIFRRHYFALFEKGKEISNWKIDAFFSEILTYKTALGLIEIGLLFQEMLVCGWNLSYLEVNGICK